MVETEVNTGKRYISSSKVEPPQKSVAKGILVRRPEYGKYGGGDIPLTCVEDSSSLGASLIKSPLVDV